MQALRSGRHVLCEKPMAMNYPEAQTMVAAGVSSGKVLGISYYRRTYPKVQRARQLLDQGAIGKPVMAYVTCHNWFTVEGGFRGWLVEPDKAGGGPLYDIASHRIDLLNFFFGQPCEATGQFSNSVHKTAVEDNATVLIEYLNGVRGIVDVRWHSRVERDEFRIIGTEGELDLTPLNGPELVCPAGREQLPTHANLHYLCVKNFVEAVLDGAPLLASGSSSVWTDWVTEKVMLAKSRSVVQ
jgi:predicted dehydrogenase